MYVGIQININYTIFFNIFNVFKYVKLRNFKVVESMKLCFNFGFKSKTNIKLKHFFKISTILYYKKYNPEPLINYHFYEQILAEKC